MIDDEQRCLWSEVSLTEQAPESEPETTGRAFCCYKPSLMSSK